MMCPNENICDTNNTFYPNYLFNLNANTTYHLTRVFTTSSEYPNASIKYGPGYNNYEGTHTVRNSENTIQVANSKITKLDDYDFSTLNYTSLTKSPVQNYENYSYALLDNINSIEAQSRQDLGKDTIAINTAINQVAKVDGKDQIFLNGKQINAVTVEYNWYHFDYQKLTNEYNLLKSIDVDGKIAYLVIKNGNITKEKKEK